MASRILTAAAILLLVAGCSTRPREFRATLAPTVASPPERFDADMLRCQVLVRKGVKKGFAGSAAQLALGTGGGILAGGAAGTAGTTLSSTISIGASTMFVVGPLVGFGISRAIRSGREKKYRSRLETCLGEYGYQVAGWEKQKKLTKADIAAAVAAMQAAGNTGSTGSMPAPSETKPRH